MMIDDFPQARRAPIGPVRKSGPAGAGTSIRVVAIGIGALLLAAAGGSALGLAIAKARQSETASIQNPWSPRAHGVAP